MISPVDTFSSARNSKSHHDLTFPKHHNTFSDQIALVVNSNIGGEVYITLWKPWYNFETISRQLLGNFEITLRELWDKFDTTLGQLEGNLDTTWWQQIYYWRSASLPCGHHIAILTLKLRTVVTSQGLRASVLVLVSERCGLVEVAREGEVCIDIFRLEMAVLRCFFFY